MQQSPGLIRPYSSAYLFLFSVTVLLKQVLPLPLLVLPLPLPRGGHVTVLAQMSP
jgi:hypothetical protein